MSAQDELSHSGTRLAQLAEPGWLLQAAVAQAPVGIQIFARDGRCVFVNEAHTELFGAVPPPDWNVLHDPALRAQGVSDLVRRALAGERLAPVWYDLHTPAGRHIAVSVEIVPLRRPDGEIEHVLFVFHDMTSALENQAHTRGAALAAEQARAAAESSAAQSAFLAEAGRVLAASLDYHTTLSQVARLATPTLADFCIVDLLGEDGRVERVAAVHADPEAQNTLDELVRSFPPKPGSPQPAARVIASGRPELLADVDSLVVADHTTTPEHNLLILRLGIRSHLAVPLVVGQRTLGAISLGYVGGRRYREVDVPLVEALASRAAVAIEHARLYRAAEEARAQAEAASRAKDEFLAMLGHELRNPLAPIVTALELTHSREGPSRERAIIERQVEHLRRLIDDLLDVARITRGKLELERQPLELATAVHEGLELARPLLLERQHRLTLHMPAGLVVLGDQVRLAQIIANLLSNAAKYTEPRGEITVIGERRAQEVILRVRDNGMGMPSELVPHVFDRFVQGARSLDRGAGGLGLGLAIVRALTELHGGRVGARSEGLGRGSEFEVVLPLAPEPNEPEAAPELEQTPVPLGRLLVVDDNVDAAELIAESLVGHGYQVAVAFEPYDALAKARAAPPDLALLDIGLPGMDGYELARRMRQEPALAAVKIVALTGYGQPSDRKQSQAAGFVEHLTKPVSLERLRAVVARLLR
jgi:signal transduction histidine kinase